MVGDSINQYREEILEHWQNPQNFGEMKKPDLIIDQVNPLCGDEVTFYFKFSPFLSSPRHACRQAGKRGSRNWIPDQVGNDKTVSSLRQLADRTIADVSFIGKGCAISVASASILSEEMKGRSVHDLSKLTGDDVFRLLGGPVAPARLKCAFLPLEVLRKLNS